MKRVGRTSDVARAISRSRRTRAALRARRRRTAALAVLIAGSLGGAEIWFIGAATGADMVEAAVTQAKSLADLIAQRSPGERTEALLTKSRANPLSKLQHAAARRGSIRHAPPVPKVKITADVAKLLRGAPMPTSVITPQAGSLPQFALEAPPSMGATVAPPHGETPPGGSPPSSFPTPQPKSPITVPSAVPEPDTWATMLLGFGLLGWRMRRLRARAAAQPRQLNA